MHFEKKKDGKRKVVLVVLFYVKRNLSNSRVGVEVSK